MNNRPEERLAIKIIDYRVPPFASDLYGDMPVTIRQGI
jgi:hypothetical protein